eukprot:PhM_4_TR7669/c0_g1_i1/m.67291
MPFCHQRLQRGLHLFDFSPQLNQALFLCFQLPCGSITGLKCTQKVCVMCLFLFGALLQRTLGFGSLTDHLAARVLLCAKAISLGELELESAFYVLEGVGARGETNIVK